MKKTRKKTTGLTVDLAEKIGTVTCLGTGTLYGVVENYPTDEMIQTIRPSVVGNSPEAGHQQPLGAAIPVAKRIANYGGRVQIRLAEWLTKWPYEFRGLEDWYAKLELIVKRVKDAGIGNVDGYELWNEADGTWLGEYIVPVDETSDYYLTFRDVWVAKSGRYKITIRYANGNNRDIKAKVLCEGGDEQIVTFPSTKGWFRSGAAGRITFELRLEKGSNRIRIKRASKGYLEYDYLEIEDTKPQRIQADLATARKNAIVVVNGYTASKKTEGLTFHEFFSLTQKKLKELDPSAKTIGPSFCIYTHVAMKNFLEFQKEQNTVPDIICWHQLSDDDFTANYEDYRNLEQELDIQPLPITINEYSGGGWFEEEGMPGTNVPLIAKFERLGIDSACQTYWNSNQGSLSSSLTDDFKPNGGFWMYKWYADMSGQMVMTIPEDVYDPRWLDCFACIDEAEGYISVIFGGESVGTVRLTICGIPESFATHVKVRLECTKFVDRFCSVESPVVMDESVYDVTNGKITILCSEMNSRDGYRAYITPCGK